MPPFDAHVQSSAVCALVTAPDHLFGFAVFHQEQRRLQICEFTEDSHASRTEAIFLQLQPKTCCIPGCDAENMKRLRRIAESCGVHLIEARAADLKQVDVEQDLLKLLVDAPECGLGRHLEEQRKKQGMRALAALLGQQGLLQEAANLQACTLSLYPLSSFMYLDKAAFSALNVLPRPDESLRSISSLFGFLNRCRSPVGSRRLRQWLTQPLTDPAEISTRHDIVEAFCSAEDLLRKIEAHMRHVPDLERMAARFHCSGTGTKSKAPKATIEDMVHLYQCLLSAEKVVADLETYQGVHAETLLNTLRAPLQVCMRDFQNFRALVEQTIDLKQAEHRTYCISMNFDASLQQLAGQRDRVREEMESLRQAVDAALQLPTMGNQKAVTLTECPEGQALRVTKKHQQAVTNFKGSTRLKFKILSIKKMEMVFTTAELETLNKQLQGAIKAYEEQSEQLVSKALTVASTYSSVMDRLSEVLGSLDVLASFSRVVLAAPCGFVRPTLESEGEGQRFEIEGATHVLVLTNSDKSFVPNDLAMQREGPKGRLQIITGPNMGGKSTFIRSVAMIALLNQIGSFVPCKSAALPIFDSIMCRVGASDMQLRGISTFMAEMLEASCILNSATQRSLVIVDELGRGTSTSDGFGIAWAIAQHLAAQTRCYSLFATHFHELAGLQEAVPGVCNRHATAAVDPASGRLTFLYALADGAADQSYGAHVAELAGFPSRVVAAARKHAEAFERGATFGQGPAKRQRTAPATAAVTAGTGTGTGTGVASEDQRQGQGQEQGALEAQA